MSKDIKSKLFLVSFMVISIMMIAVIKASSENRRDYKSNFTYNSPLFGSELYRSNRYTMPEDNKRFEYGELIIPDSFEPISENNNYILYFEEETLSIKLKDKQSQYVWSSKVDHMPEGENNTQTENFMQSGVTIDYYSYSTKSQSTSTKTNRMDLLSGKAVTRVTKTNNGVVTNVNFAQLNISFDVEISLEDSGVKVHIPNESIREDKNIIAAIYVMPFMGASRLDEIPGYMFVPDGSGALIRYTNNEGKNIKQYAARFSGQDNGLTKKIENDYWQVAPKRLTAPVFGMVHGVNQNGLIGIIESGAVNAELLINPNGAGRINYNWISPRFLLRESTFIPTDLSGNGIQVLEPNKKPDDITVMFNFLHNDQANYVGMAKSYQQYLVNENILSKTDNEDPLMRLEILASDSENGLFGPKVIPMTTTEEMKKIVNDLRENHVDDLLLVIRGWNDGGMSGQSPYKIDNERKVGSERDFSKFMNSMEDYNIPVYYYNDYVIGYSDSDRINARQDVAKALYKMQLEFDLIRQPVYDKYFYVNPLVSQKIARNDIDDYKDLGIHNLALDSMGQISFSFKDDGNYTVSDTTRIYAEIADTLAQNGNLALYEPNHYMWEYTTNYLDMPMYSSQFNFYTDNVPFLQIVLKGYMNYYAPFINFFANHDEQILQLIDYGMYPSFIITDDSSHKLKYTNANEFFTTEYSEWRSTIIEDYQVVSETLNHVKDATITSRVVLAPGVVRVDYSNNVSFVINYSTEDYNYQVGNESITIDKQNFVALGVSE